MEFSEFNNWVYSQFKINLNAYKQEQLNRRINSLMSRCRVSSLEEYKKVLIENKEQREKFIDFITINVTEFFRNPELFNELKNIIKDYSKKNNNLKIWSAACSMGCEPYSVAMLIDDINPGIKFNILATDIDKNILNKAQIGSYTIDDMKNVSMEYKSKYFNLKDNQYCVSPKIKSKVTFKKHDLIVDSYTNDFDLIICRNVIIYFKNEVKNEILRKFSNSLKKGGILFVGATENIYNCKEFNLEKLSTFFYRKV